MSSILNIIRGKVSDMTDLQKACFYAVCIVEEKYEVLGMLRDLLPSNEDFLKSSDILVEVYKKQLLTSGEIGKHAAQSR